MDLKKFHLSITGGDIVVPTIKEGRKVKGVVNKKVESGVLVECCDGTFTGIILSKESKDLEKAGFQLTPGLEIDAEILNTDMRHDEGYYIISISKLLQYDIWKGIIQKSEADTVFTVIPTEANLGGLLVDMHGIKGFIPLSQLAPIHYPRVEDGDQEKIFQKLLSMIGQEFTVRIINIDEDNKRIILSEREALREEREKVMAELEVGKMFDGHISGISSYGLFVTIGGGIEGLVHISEITYGHVDSIDKFGKIGDPMRVKVIGLDKGKISLSSKKLKEDPWAVIGKTQKIGDVVDGEVIRFVPYGIFVRVFDDINGLIHLSEVGQSDTIKAGQKIKAKIILLDIAGRKIGLSIKAMNPGSDGDKPAETDLVAEPKKKPKAKIEAE